MSGGALVVNADDLGVSESATLGIVRAHREGIVTSASLCVTTPWYRHALDSCVRQCPELGVGLHVTLTLGAPASDPAAVPLLVDDRGRLRWNFSSLLLATSMPGSGELLRQVELEVDAQFARLVSDGVRPDHVDGERHVHLIPGVFERVASAARRHGVRFIRAGRDRGADLVRPRDMPTLIANGGFVKSLLLSRLAARARTLLEDGLTSPDYVVSYLYTGRIGDVLSDVLARVHPGVTEVMLHPGMPRHGDAASVGDPAIDRYLMSPDRERELEASITARKQPTAWQLTNYGMLAKRRT